MDESFEYLLIYYHISKFENDDFAKKVDKL